MGNSVSQGNGAKTCPRSIAAHAPLTPECVKKKKKENRRVWGLWRLERVITDCVDEGYWAKGGDVASPPAERVVRGASSGNPKRRANRHVAAHERDGDAGRPLFRR